jgi:hypothetical protein
MTAARKGASRLEDSVRREKRIGGVRWDLVTWTLEALEKVVEV